MENGIESDFPLTARRKLAHLAPKRAIEILGPELMRTPRLALRPLMLKDRYAFVEAIRSGRDVLDRYYDLWHPGDTDHEVFERQIELARAGAISGKACRRAAFLDDGRFVGCFNLCNIEPGLECHAEAGWWVNPALGRLGLGAEGVRGLLEFALDTLPGALSLGRVSALIHPQNASSQRLAARVGMREETHEAASVLLNGEWIPHVVFSKSIALVG
jgi:RimJ/RimL family protein N-acetyltransferase